ncbi:hypothetical protein DFJ58DRAFT_848421 [Suillus subalutaceus]|uniref:uncharacterized protein n=1 Tax=Suillus subalutaceus TaxID=48586 RepID=UPI001B87421F|nr:uncharacterized protein DFJ58DRAFT_848421 [Suillus subalutaceus]KAG1830672.1 hypothetical protein DFJ58DRAFT_848421 [Suillus subalutaceus]
MMELCKVELLLAKFQRLAAQEYAHRSGSGLLLKNRTCCRLLSPSRLIVVLSWKEGQPFFCSLGLWGKPDELAKQALTDFDLMTLFRQSPTTSDSDISQLNTASIAREVLNKIHFLIHDSPTGQSTPSISKSFHVGCLQITMMIYVVITEGPVPLLFMTFLTIVKMVSTVFVVLE